VSKLLFVGLGGFAGAVARYLLISLVRLRFPGAFPLGTLAVNVLGCLAAGALLGVLEARGGLSDTARLLLLVGFLGSFTTFSTFGMDAYQLLREGEGGAALLYVGANVLLGLAAVAGAFLAVTAWTGRPG
jgi:CrcB protein